MIAAKEIVVSISGVRYAGNYELEIAFSDGIIKVVDFAPFLKSSHHPDTRKYLDKKKFANFSLTHGVLQWNDFDLVFPMSDLYKGEISTNHLCVETSVR